MRQQQGFGSDFDGLLHHVLGCMRNVADEAQTVTREETQMAASERLVPFTGGTTSSNPLSSSGESGANSDHVGADVLGWLR
jgi:hypothetical protein